MADTTALKNRIRAAIKANDNQEITGPILQQALLDIVDELDLYPELQNETQARQTADTQLNNLITSIKNNIDNGYVYAGIATPSTTPVSGKVFYIAMAAGTYTNFGSTEVFQGINILKYNGTAWLLDTFIGIDNEPTADSNNFVKSGGVYSALKNNPRFTLFTKKALVSPTIASAEDIVCGVYLENANGTPVDYEVDVNGVPYYLSILSIRQGDPSNDIKRTVSIGYHPDNASSDFYRACIFGNTETNVFQGVEHYKKENIQGFKTVEIWIDWDKYDKQLENLNNQYSLYRYGKNAAITSYRYKRDYTPLTIDDTPTDGSANAVSSGGVYDKVKPIEDALTVNKLEEEYTTTLEQGTYKVNTGSKRNSTLLCRANPLDVDAIELKSVTCDDAYYIIIYGNNEGINNPIVAVQGGRVSTFDFSNFPYKYAYVIIGKNGGEELDVSELDGKIVFTHLVQEGYKKCAIQKGRRSNPIIVDINGNGDYTSLQDAIDNARDTANNPKTIIVLPGTYVMSTGNNRNMGGYRHLSIIGTDKNNCILRNDRGYYITGENYEDDACLRLAGNVYIANLTIISTDTNYPAGKEANRHMAYCIHADFSANAGNVMEINNCILVNNHFACIGAGLKDNYTVKIVDCELTSTMHAELTTSYEGTIITHNGSNGSTEESRQHLYVKDCVITNTNGAYGIQSASAYDGQLADFTLINNIVDVPAESDGFSMSSNYSLTKKCYGNNISSMNYTV